MSKRAWGILAVTSLLQHLAFVTLCLRLQRMESVHRLVALTWMVLPALVAAIAVRDIRTVVIVGVVNGLAAGGILAILFLAKWVIWAPVDAHNTPGMIRLAVVTTVFGVAVGCVCGRFVHSVKSRLGESCKTRWRRCILGVIKGLSFSGVCVLATLPVLLILLPRGLSVDRLVSVSVWYSGIGLIAGSAVGAIIGATHESRRSRCAAARGSTPDMNQFPSAQHLASWAGLCPGNEESAGKRKRRRTTKGNVWLQRALCEAAWAAGRSKDTYFQAQYRRLAGRRGKKRAIVAVAYSLLDVFYQLLKYGNLEYHELGGNYFDTLDPMRLRRHLVKRLESLGYEVTLAERKAA